MIAYDKIIKLGGKKTDYGVFSGVYDGFNVVVERRVQKYWYARSSSKSVYELPKSLVHVPGDCMYPGRTIDVSNCTEKALFVMPHLDDEDHKWQLALPSRQIKVLVHAVLDHGGGKRPQCLSLFDHFIN